MGNAKLIHDLNLRLVRMETERDNLLQELERLARENGRLQAAVEAAQEVVADHEDDLAKYPQVMELARALAALEVSPHGA